MTKKRIPERVRQLPDKPSLARLFGYMCNLDIPEPETGGGGGGDDKMVFLPALPFSSSPSSPSFIHPSTDNWYSADQIQVYTECRKTSNPPFPFWGHLIAWGKADFLFLRKANSFPAYVPRLVGSLKAPFLQMK